MNNNLSSEQNETLYLIASDMSTKIRRMEFNNIERYLTDIKLITSIPDDIRNEIFFQVGTLLHNFPNETEALEKAIIAFNISGKEYKHIIVNTGKTYLDSGNYEAAKRYFKSVDSIEDVIDAEIAHAKMDWNYYDILDAIPTVIQENREDRLLDLADYFLN